MEGSEIKAHLAYILVATTNFSVASATGRVVGFEICRVLGDRVAAPHRKGTTHLKQYIEDYESKKSLNSK